MKLFCYPDKPGTWSKLHAVITTLGWRYGTREDHDLRTYFSGATINTGGVRLDRRGRRPAASPSILPKTINSGCVDVSKSAIERAFSKELGYASFVDPSGVECVEKTEIQAIKKIRRVAAGSPQRSGYVYQREINTFRDRAWTDLRPVVYDGRILGVVVKKKSDWIHGDADARIELASPLQVFSADELARIEAGCRGFGAHFAELDVLRDRDNGKVYVVDLNYTAHRNSFDLIKKQMGGLEGQEYVRRYAARFEQAFNNDRWLVR